MFLLGLQLSAEVVEAGLFEHPCEGEAVCKLSNTQVTLMIIVFHYLIKETEN